MNEKDLIKLLKEKEWKKFLTRPYNFHFVSLHARAYHSELKRITGDDCYTFYFCQHGLVEIYRDKDSFAKINKNFCDLALETLQLYKIIKNIIYYKNLLAKIDKTDQQEHVKIFTHLTALPFNLGNIIIENDLHRTNIGYQKILSVLQEIRCLNYYHKLSGKYLEKQNADFVYLAIGNRAYYSFNNQLIEEIKLHFDKNVQHGQNSEIRGVVAYAGKARGRVRKIFNVQQSKKFQAGEILVSHSTNPELLPVIKKAAAIITDEGGMMSHAAILSRELKIPCLVGTGMATKVFNDGDLVEVDAVLGVVKKI